MECLTDLIAEQGVRSVELAAVEAWGVKSEHILLFDLFKQIENGQLDAYESSKNGFDSKYFDKSKLVYQRIVSEKDIEEVLDVCEQ